MASDSVPAFQEVGAFLQIRVRPLLAFAVGMTALLAASTAAAQTSVQHSRTTFVVHAAPVPEGEQIAAPGQPLLRQKVTATRAARLEEDAPSLLGATQVKVFPAGTAMFGVQVPDGWIYCAVSKTTSKFWFSDVFACYQDVDGDGRFDHVRNSGTPFQNVPLFVFQPGPAVALPAPVRYAEIPYADGPEVEIAFTWTPEKVRTRQGETPKPPSTAGFGVAMLTDKGPVQIASLGNRSLAGGPVGTVRDAGAMITILGLTPEGSLRYRVVSTMPAQIQPMKMTITTSTYYYVVSY